MRYRHSSRQDYPILSKGAEIEAICMVSGSTILYTDILILLI